MGSLSSFEDRQMNSTIEVSVIITTKNEEHNIENCFASIKKQTYSQDKIEIIIMDNIVNRIKR